MMDYNIRQASTRDAGQVALFASKAFASAYQGLMPDTDISEYVNKAFGYESIVYDMENTNAVFHLLEINNEMLGYTKLRYDRVREELKGFRAMEMERIYVSATNYRSGLGTRLFQHALEYSRHQGFNLLWLAVWQKNLRALSFYQKSGMEIFGVQSFQVGSIINDDYVLRISI